MPHATYTCSPEGLTEVVETLRKVLTETGRPGLLTTHVSETAAENAGIRERYDATPTELLSRTGWLEPDLPLVLAPRRAPHRRPTASWSRRRVRPSGTAPGRTSSWPAAPCTGRRCGRAASGSASAPTAARAPTTSTCGRRCARWPWSPGSPAAGPTSRAPPRCCGRRPSTAPGRSASATGSARSRWASGPTSCSLDLAAPHLTPVHDVAALLVFAAGRGDVTDVLVDGRPRGARPAQHAARHRRPPRPRRRARGDVARAAVEAL